jgi:hypothetical protein
MQNPEMLLTIPTIVILELPTIMILKLPTIIILNLPPYRTHATPAGVPCSFKGSRTAPELVDFVNVLAGTKAFLKGPAASAGKVPTLTPEAKVRYE